MSSTEEQTVRMSGISEHNGQNLTTSATPSTPVSHASPQTPLEKKTQDFDVPHEESSSKVTPPRHRTRKNTDRDLAAVAREIAQNRNVYLGQDGKPTRVDFEEGHTVLGKSKESGAKTGGQMYLCSDMGFNMYDNYNTYTSMHSRDSSEGILCPSFPAGVIRFVLEGGEDQKDRYYVSVPKDASMDDVARFMASAWRRRTPKLVLTVINSSRYFQPWTKEKFAEEFQAGIIQAANLTEMWILTEGLDLGVSKLIGDAAFVEMTRRKNMELNPLHIKNINAERLPRLNIMGVVSKSCIVYADILNGSHTAAYSVQNVGGKPNLQLFELNPDHTHFVLVEDDLVPDSEALTNFRFALEMRFTKPVGRPRRYCQNFTTLLGSETNISTHDVDPVVTPVIGLLVQGGPSDIDHTLGLLKKKIPVVVIRGSGLAADLVSFAYQEMEERGDAEYLDTYIKPELVRRVSEAFPQDFVNNEIARNQCRDKIIECVRYAHQDNLTFLTIINTFHHDVRLNDLSKYLLMALFKSQLRKKGRQWKEQLQWDLQLTLDWNRPDLAHSEIFNRYNLEKFRVGDHIFHQALIRPNREAFVELFLDRGMEVHMYLNHKRLHNLFENAIDKDFFIGVCIETVLGKTVVGNTGLSNDFIGDVNCDLNRLLYKCTGLQKLVNPYELSMNSLGSYVTNRAVAERRAINTLVLWAALTNRPELAKVLWKRTEDPMAMALIVSMILHRLGSRWCKDLDLRQRIKESAAKFGKMAVEMLKLTYAESSTFAFSALSKCLDDFNNRTVVELAKMSENKYFIAHPCCQKWLAQRWLGNIHVRELDWGYFKLPDFIKIYLSVFLIFPMFLWITFVPTDGDKNVIIEEDEDEVIDEAAENSMLLRITSVEDKLHYSGKNRKRKKKGGLTVTIKNALSSGNGSYRLPFWKQIYYLWAAPITKFWLNLMFSIAYLALFSIALMMPACGSVVLNSIVFVWTLTIWVELTRRTFVKKRRYPEVRIKWHCIEIIGILLFILTFLAVRILPHFVEYVTYMTSKFFMSLGLLFFYYRTMGTYIPISPTLGPAIVSVIAMTKKDFYNWMRLYLMVLVSGAITIHAVIYPSAPIAEESIRAALQRAIFGLFLTKIDDLDGQPCSKLYHEEGVGYCKAGSVLTASQLKTLETCPHGSWANYVMVVQYLFNVKLIFVTILYAMFSSTMGKVQKESIEIWKYQRYMMVVDFEERLILPTPLTLLTYIMYVIKWTCQLIWMAIRRMLNLCRCCRKKPDYADAGSKIQIVKFRRTQDYNYWKSCIERFVENEKAVEKEENRAKAQSESLDQLLEEVRQHRALGRQLNDRIIQMETNFTNSCLLLEEMKHMIERLNPKTQVLPQEPQKLLHISARQSPYPGTRIRRFPVFDKYVLWEVVYDSYDPAVYTKPVSEFPERIQIFVDPDILQLRQQLDERQKLPAEEAELLPSLPEFHPLHNALTSTVINDINIEVDRTSWIAVDNHPLRYKLDATDLPQNPLGRTGLRGRGKLWRWGPNHSISAVVTRWRRKYSPLGRPLDPLLVEGKRVLEFIIVQRPDTGEMTLPGGNVYGKTTAYSVMCEQFLKGVFQEEEVEGSLKLDQEDMVNFFAQFARSSSSLTFTDSRMDMAACGFSASIIYRGYIDDIANTDNAWREAEVWNFHYELCDMFDDKIKEREKVWREVSPYMRLYGNQDSIVLKAAHIHNAYL